MPNAVHLYEITAGIERGDFDDYLDAIEQAIYARRPILRQNLIDAVQREFGSAAVNALKEATHA